MPDYYRIVRQLAPSRTCRCRSFRLGADAAERLRHRAEPRARIGRGDPGHPAILDERELRGVLAHELSHVANRDILVSSIAAAIGVSITFLARFAFFFGGSHDEGGGNIVALLIASILAPIAAMMIQMAVTRSREYQADESGAFLSRDPDALASALLKLEQASKQVPPLASVSPAEAHMFIVNPMNALQARGRGGITSLFRTHPPTEARVERLRAIASELRGERGPIG